VKATAAPERPLQKRDVELAHFIVCKGEDIYLKMLLVNNLMHADLVS